jgi:glycosyltransferase involved in cell wall biosynthesis
MSRALSVVIPAYNEEDGIGGVIAEVRNLLERHGIETEIVVVDDGSRDRTARAAAEAGARVLRHRSNRGYGAGLKTGIVAARHDNIAIIDADGTYPASYLPAMLEMLDKADMVVGARTGNNVEIPLARRPAKWLLTRLANYLTSSRIPDLNSGLRVFRRNIATQYFPILPDQFSWTTTITLAMHCDKYAVAYLPIDYRERKGQSKIVPWDAGTFFMLMLRTIMLFRPLRVFLPIVVACLVYGAVKMSIDLTHQPNISASALLAFLSALLVLLIGMVSDAIAMRLGRIGMEATAGVRAEEYSIEEDASAGERRR